MSSDNSTSQSVRDRLLNLRDEFEGKVSNQLLLTRYGCERLLYRLSISEYASDFVLKGATMFWNWTGEIHRPTRDIDFLGFGAPDKDRLETIFHRVSNIEVDDGIEFDSETLTAKDIRHQSEYHGIRLKIVGVIAGARAHVQIDVGFGDSGRFDDSYEVRTLLDTDSPIVRAYTRPTLIAEKFHTIVLRGMANSRVKDYYDIYFLASEFAFDGHELFHAIEQTFERRETEIPKETPRGLTRQYAQNADRKSNWQALKKGLSDSAPSLDEVVSGIRSFLEPIREAAASESEFSQKWPMGGPWQ
jgi:hypothetical protein